VVSAAGVVLFGWYALRVLAISAAVALLIESLFHTLGQRSRRWSEGQALLIGLLTACTLPPTAGWHIVATASAVAVLIGLIVPGGVGNYLWNPVALGRIAVQLLFGEQLAGGWAVLAPARLLTGDLMLAHPLPPLAHWATATVPSGVEAWRVTPAIEVLTSPAPLQHGHLPAGALADRIADGLPAWSDTLTGVAGGAIGEACVLAAIAAGLVLTWQGLLRWRTILAGLGAAAVLAAVLPAYFQMEGSASWSVWLPVRLFDEGVPVGFAYLAYQMTAGALPLVLLVLAADPTSSPLTTRGQIVFGAMIGATAMLLRVLTGIPASDYWALLVANTCTPVINRLTRRRVFGTAGS
jgi:Na+-translocating ferredoxin:NAD+ oxidoreductase subunit D